MFFHASPVPNLKNLTPHISNHGTPLIYFSTKRENVLVYLSNAVEKCCRKPVFIMTAHGRNGEVMALPKMVFSFSKSITLMPRLKPTEAFPVIFIPQKTLRMPYLSLIFRLLLRPPLPQSLTNANMFRTLMKHFLGPKPKAGSSCTAFRRTAGKNWSGFTSLSNPNMRSLPPVRTISFS